MNKDIFEHNIECLMNVIIRKMERKDIITYGEEQEIQSIVEDVFYQSLDELVKENNKLEQELQRKDNIINEVKDIINRMIYMGYCAKTGKGTTATNFMAVGEQSEFGTRAKYILGKIKELEEKK